MKKEFTIFIGSVEKQLTLARNIQLKINRYKDPGIKFNAIVWDEGDFFRPGQYGLHSLIRELKNIDLAIIILTPDDEIKTAKTKTKFIPRDNLLFELGLCYGNMGIGKVIALIDNRLNFQNLLSDFRGITYVSFDAGDIETNSGSVSSSVTAILQSFQKTILEEKKHLTYFKEKMISWRIDREASKYEDIEKGVWNIYALSENSYKRYVFSGVLSVLGEGDRYSTVSNLNFWSGEGFDVDLFIQNNLEALKEQVKIRRIIVIKKSIFESISKDSFGDYSLKLLKELVDKLVFKKKENKKLFSKMKLFFLVPEDYTRDVGAAPVPYAIIENNKFNDHALITPDFERNPKVTSIIFKPGSEKKDMPNNFFYLNQKFETLFKSKQRKTLVQMQAYITRALQSKKNKK